MVCSEAFTNGRIEGDALADIEFVIEVKEKNE